MRPIRSLLIYLFVVFLGGALLAPQLYFLVQMAAFDFPGLKKLADNPFHRFVNRSLLILAVVGLWPLLRSLGIKSWRDLGLGNGREMWGDLGLGGVLGFVSFAVAAGVCLLATERDMVARDASVLGQILVQALFSALFVSVLEEIVFRGAIFGGLRRAMSWKSALVGSSFIYALVHFFSTPRNPAEITWGSGIVILGQMLKGFTEFQSLIPALLNLVVAGMILGLAFEKTGKLYLCIGLHAGWIFWLKSFGAVTSYPSRGSMEIGEELKAARRAEAWLFGSEKLIDGWAAGIVLVVLFVFLAWWLRIKNTSHLSKAV